MAEGVRGHGREAAPGTPIPLQPPPPTRPPASFKKLGDSPWATSLRDQLRENAPILEERVTILEAYHADLVKKPADRLAQVEVQADPAAGYYDVDHKTGSNSAAIPAGPRPTWPSRFIRASSSSRWSRRSATTRSYMGLSTGDQSVVSAETAKTLRAILDD